LAIVIDERDLIPFIYYAMQALPHDMVGIAMTNAGRQVVPTFGSEARCGTNPTCLLRLHKRSFLLSLTWPQPPLLP
jgi:LDH2 family malate/lactate/ureidoglycolate dehydrogenase